MNIRNVETENSVWEALMRADTAVEVGSKEYLEKLMVAIVDPEEPVEGAEFGDKG